MNKPTEILVYGTPMCGNCKTAVTIINNSGFLTAKKVDATSDKIDELINMGFSSFPVLYYDGEYYDGFPISKTIELVNNLKHEFGIKEV